MFFLTLPFYFQQRFSIDAMLNLADGSYLYQPLQDKNNENCGERWSKYRYLGWMGKTGVTTFNYHLKNGGWVSAVDLAEQEMQKGSFTFEERSILKTRFPL